MRTFDKIQLSEQSIFMTLLLRSGFTRIIKIGILSILIAITCIGQAQQFPDISIVRHETIKLRDGVTLHADLYLPNKSDSFPTIVVRTPYSVQRPGMHETMVRLARHGYAVVLADVRGRYESGGHWDPFRYEAHDGYDIIEWAAAQPFSNGRVATQGGSYLGHNQWQAAAMKPPHLVAIFPILASTNIYANWLTMGGAFRLSFNYGWGAVRMPFKIMLPQFWHMEDYMTENLLYENVLQHLPLSTMDVYGSGTLVPHYREWIRHQSYDQYWKEISDEERFDQVEVPAYNMGGWFDIFIDGTINGYTGLRTSGGTQAARDGTRLIVGPWGHGVSKSFGDVDFGDAAVIDLFDLQLQFYDLHLKGIDRGLGERKPVELFYMGVNQWREEDDWPIPGTDYQSFYIRSEGSANSVRGNGVVVKSKPSRLTEDSYVYDPLHPVPTTGGNNCCGTPTPSGPRDQRPLERREDVLVYTSEVLTDSLAIAGPITMKLFAATDGPDTDWMIKLVDVYPDGFAMPVSEGILRARFREGLDQMNLLTPGNTYEYDIHMTPTANVFLPGHRLRIDITSSNFPQFDRNPNTGHDLGVSDEIRKARQTIFHGGRYASHITLPVVTTPTRNP